MEAHGISRKRPERRPHDGRRHWRRRRGPRKRPKPSSWLGMMVSLVIPLLITPMVGPTGGRASSVAATETVMVVTTKMGPTVPRGSRRRFSHRNLHERWGQCRPTWCTTTASIATAASSGDLSGRRHWILNRCKAQRSSVRFCRGG